MATFINEEQLEIGIKKLQMYKKSLNLNFESLLKCLTNLNYDYKTNNTDTLEDLKKDIKNKEKTINVIHNNNIYVLEKEINIYTETKKSVENKFNKII